MRNTNKEKQKESGKKGREGGHQFEYDIEDSIHYRRKFYFSLINGFQKFFSECIAIEMNDEHHLLTKKKHSSWYGNDILAQRRAMKNYCKEKRKEIKAKLAGKSSARVSAKMDLAISLVLKDGSRVFVPLSAKCNAGVQVQAGSSDSFDYALWKIYEIKKNETAQRAYLKFLGAEGHTPSEVFSHEYDLLEYHELNKEDFIKEKMKSLKQGENERFLTFELTEEEQYELDKFFRENGEEILTLVIRQGTIIDSRTYVDFLIIKTGKDTVEIFSIKEIIKENKDLFSFTKEGSMRYGIITFQRKGSGSAKERANPQWNISTSILNNKDKKTA